MKIETYTQAEKIQQDISSIELIGGIFKHASNVFPEYADTRLSNSDLFENKTIIDMWKRISKETQNDIVLFFEKKTDELNAEFEALGE